MNNHSALANTLKALGYPRPECEYPVPGTDRKWRFDLAWPNQKFAIECQGGIWTGGRHTRGKGYAGDCEKLNHAQLTGWQVLYVASDWWQTGEVFPLLDFVFKGKPLPTASRK